MKKIKITENQKGMLDRVGARLQESIPPSHSPSLKVTKAFKSATKGLGIKTENTEDVVIGGLEWAELVPHVLEFIKKLYTNPTKEGLDPFWGQVGLTWDDMIQMLTRLDLIKSVSGGYRLTKFVNEPIKNVKIVGRILEKMVNDKYQPQEVMPETVEKKHNDIANSFRQQVSEPKKTGKTRQELLDVIVTKRAEELKRREGEVKPIGEDGSERIDQYINRVGGAGMLPKHKFSTGDKVLVDMGDGTKEKLTVNKPKMMKAPKGKFHLTYSMIEYGDNMIFTEDMLLKLLSKISDANGLEEGDWFDNRTDHPANQVDNTERGIRPELSPYNIMWFSDDVAIFSKDGQFFAFNVSSTDNDEYAEYADREAIDMGQDEDGFADIEYGEWTLDADVVSAYVNDNADHLNFGKGLDDYENGVDMSLITQDLAADLLSFANYVGGEQGAKLNQILTTINLEEATSAAGSSGAFVGKMGGSPAPIHKGNVSSEMDMITDAEVYDADEDRYAPERDILNTLKGFMKDTKMTPTEWFVFRNDLKVVADKIQSLMNEEWNPVIMFIVKSLQIAEAVVKKGDNSGVGRFRGYLRSLRQFVNHFELTIGEATTVTSAGGSSGTFAYDAPVGDGGEFWTAGNKMAKKGVNEDAKTDTQYPKGEFVEFDDCVKYNNNKVAQNGGCSVGAVDNVVKTRSSKNSVISDNALYLEISKATGRSISEVKSLIENKIK